jgi:hypothetical protein
MLNLVVGTAGFDFASFSERHLYQKLGLLRSHRRNSSFRAILHTLSPDALDFRTNRQLSPCRNVPD